MNHIERYIQLYYLILHCSLFDIRMALISTVNVKQQLEAFIYHQLLFFGEVQPTSFYITFSSKTK